MTARNRFVFRVLALAIFGQLSPLPMPASEPAKAEPQRLSQLWSRLLERNAIRAHPAVQEFASFKDEAVSFLRVRLRPVHAEHASLSELISGLNADSYAVREQSFEDLRRLGRSAEAALNQAIRTSTSLELHCRAMQLLWEMETPVMASSEGLRFHRAIQVLEQIGSRRATKLLEEIAGGAATAHATIQSRAVLRRLRCAVAERSANLDRLTTPTWKAEPQLHRVIAHDRRVFDVAFDSDGQRFASASGVCHRGVVRVFDIESRAELVTIETGLPAFCLDFSPDGQFVATGGGGLYEPDRASADVWDANTGERIASLVGHAGAVLAIAYSPDGRWIATGSVDGTVRIWDACTGRALYVFFGHAGAVYDLAISPDGRYIASCGGRGRSQHQPGELIVWEVASGQPLFRLDGHHGPVLCVAFRGDGRRLASGGADGSVRLWDLATGKETDRLHGHSRYVQDVAFNPGDGHIAAIGMRGAIRIWDAAALRRVFRFPTRSTARAFRVAYSPEGKYLATAGPGLSVNVWRFPNQLLHDRTYSVEGRSDAPGRE